MTEVIASNPENGSSIPDESSAPTDMSDLDKIKAAQAARRTRRSRVPKAPATASAAPSETTKPADESSGEESPEMKKMREEMTTLRLEMSSLRRNHLQNLKKVTEERDMFATQLVHEQSSSGGASKTADMRKLGDAEVQLRAARTRNNDLEAENRVLRDDVKQLNFRVQANKTMAAATNGYERIVDDLVTVKVKCAELQEEKEEMLRMNKELTQKVAVLSQANGELEKSRSQWVLQCADVEKKRGVLEARVKELQEKQSMADEKRKERVRQDTSYEGSDLQDIKLN